MNPKRLVDIGFGVAALLAFLVLRQVFETIWDYFRFPIQPDWVVAPPVLLAVAVGVLVFAGLRKNGAATAFSTEVVLELFKVTWPLKKETMASTVIVVVMVGIASVILFLFDSMWGTVTQKFFGSL